MADHRSLKRGLSEFWPHWFFVSALLVVVTYAVVDPEYNWDVVGYTGAALQPECSSAADLHHAAFTRLRESLSDSKYHELATEGGDYRGIVASDPQAFLEQIPFYTSKPLYVALIRLASIAGVEVVRAPGVVSAAATAGIAFVVYLWIGCSYARFTRVVLTLTVLALLGIPALARLASPDALSALIIVSAVYLAIMKEKPLAGALLLPLSLFARPDNLIFGLFLAGAFLLAWWKLEAGHSSRIVTFMGFLDMEIRPCFITRLCTSWRIRHLPRSH